MKVCIHRGTKEIGGTCIEIEAQGKRLVLDVGLPLDADGNSDLKSLLPPVSGFTEPDDSLLAAIVSHPHQDHYGLARYIRPDLPVMIGEDANRILKAAASYVPDGKYFENTIYYKNSISSKLGPFTITPYLMDHSAYDAYAFMIEADGKRLFYSGDFRGHGRKGKVFEYFLKHSPKNIDVLLMEGTTLSREDTEIGFATEDDLEDSFVNDICNTDGIYLVHASAQNIDRMVTLYRAAKKSGRNLIIDLYTAAVLEAAGNPNIPQSHWDGVNLWVPFNQRVQVKQSGNFDELKRHSKNRIYLDKLEDPSKYVMLFRPFMRNDLERANIARGARFAYSMWGGYLADPKNQPFLEWLSANDIPLTKIHTSGHAPTKDLKRFAAAIAPSRLVPIHSFETDSFGDFFDNVEIRNDGEWWGV